MSIAQNLTDDQEDYLLKAYRAVTVTVGWFQGGQPVRNLEWLGLVKITDTKKIAGPYPSSHGRHYWTYCLTDLGWREAARIAKARCSVRSA